jgi:hypothetical protein
MRILLEKILNFLSNCIKNNKIFHCVITQNYQMLKIFLSFEIIHKNIPFCLLIYFYINVNKQPDLL